MLDPGQCLGTAVAGVAFLSPLRGEGDPAVSALKTDTNRAGNAPICCPFQLFGVIYRG